MGSNNGWDAEEIFRKYLHDYMVKKNLHKTAFIFGKEGNVDVSPVAIDSPQGFLAEWWSLFHDVYFQMQPTLEETTEKVLNEGEQLTRCALQNLLSETYNCGINQQSPAEHPADYPVSSNVCTRPQQSPQRTCERVSRKRSAGKADTVSQVCNTNTQNGPELPGSSPRNPQRYLRKQAQNHQEKKHIGGLGTKGSSAEPKPKALAGKKDELNGSPLKGWPLIAANQIPPKIGHQVLNSYLQYTSNQPQIEMPLSLSQQELLGQLLAGATTKLLSPFPVPPNLDVLLKKELNTIDTDVRIKEENVLEESIQMFFSQYDGHADSNSASSNPQQQSTSFENNRRRGLGVSLVEVGSLHASNGKLFSCNFSHDGKLLASAGLDKKAVIWNMDTLDYSSTSENHAHLVTDVRFHPSSEIFATSSFDRTVRLWSAAEPIDSLSTLVGHHDHVMSLDFHPRKMELLCSCDSDDEFRLWNFKESTCLRVSKGATRQVRFQPQMGKLLATAAGKSINIFDVETGNFQFNLGHDSEVRSLSWDETGQYIASVSEESVRLWSILSGRRCVYELHSMGNGFQSCAFHPGNPLLLVIGSYQSLGLWNPTQGSTVDTIQAHGGLIASVSASPSTGLIASVSHDRCVKLWK